jgi:transposase
VPTVENFLTNLPEDKEALKAILRSLLLERDNQRQRADELYLENLQLQKELWRYKKATYGPRADRLSENELAQMLLEFAERLEQKPIHLEDLRQAEPEPELRRVQRRKGRRALANFKNLPAQTHVYELSAEERPCPSCGVERKEIGSEKSWQIEYIPGHFERLEHVRKKYACPSCERAGENPRIEVAAKAETAIEKGFAGPGLLAFIVTSKFADYLPLYRIEDIFERQGFEISRATQSVWCRDVANVVEPLYERMAERVKESHVVATDDTVFPMLAPGQTQSARMWVYVGDEANPYNVFDFTLNRGREGPKQFLKDYTEVLLADAYGGYNGVVAGNQITRAGCWSHARRKFVEAERAAPEIAREAVDWIGRLFALEKQAQEVSVAERLQLRQAKSLPALAELREKLLAWKEQLLPKHPMAEAVNYTLGQWEELNVFCKDGAVPIDNNVSEREMKRVVLNRKNSLLVGNPRGGRTAAILASLTSSCRRHEMDLATLLHAAADESPLVAGKRPRRLASRPLETNSRRQLRGSGNTTSRFLKPVLHGALTMKKGRPNCGAGPFYAVPERRRDWSRHGRLRRLVVLSHATTEAITACS